MRPHNVDFTIASDTTLIRLEMTKIWPGYVANAFCPPRNRQLRGNQGIGLNHKWVNIDTRKSQLF